MKRVSRYQSAKRSAVVAIFLSAAIVVTGCSEPKPPPPQARTTVTTQPGVAGGVVEDTITASAIISAIDPSTRQVTLIDSNGEKFAYIAEPEIRNFAQMKVGDKVTATLTRHTSIDVRSGGPSPSDSFTLGDARTKAGEKPGVMTQADAVVVARVKAINSTNRTATIEFSDGSTQRVPVRPDVDLTRYNVGDTVIARRTTTLSLLVESP
jgi:hypothetical protein